MGDWAIEIVERDRSAILAVASKGEIKVNIAADLYRIEDRLILDQVHVSGQGLTLAAIRTLAQVLGEREDVEEVMIQGGARTSGAHPGSRPTLIRVRVKR